MNRDFLSQTTATGFPLPPSPAPTRATRSPIHLTPRESEIARYVMLGESNKQIARRLGISNYTVRDHVSNLLKKAEVTSRSRLALVLSAPVPHAVHEPMPHSGPDPRLAAAPAVRPLPVSEAPRDLAAFWRTSR